MGRAAEVVAPSSSTRTDGGCPVLQVNDLSRSLAAFDPISTLVVVVPTMEEEAERRPSRERENLVNERSRITNRMKSALARLGIRGFKPHLRISTDGGGHGPTGQYHRGAPARHGTAGIGP